MASLSRDPAVGQGLAFSYGVHPVDLVEEPDNWRDFARTWLREQGLSGNLAMLVAGPSRRNPDANHRIEVMRVGERRERT
jgi:pyruvate kinase